MVVLGIVPGFLALDAAVLDIIQLAGCNSRFALAYDRAAPPQCRAATANRPQIELQTSTMEQVNLEGQRYMQADRAQAYLVCGGDRHSQCGSQFCADR